MRVLWLNWKDLKNPEAGGAEVFTHEVGRRLALKGFEITLFTSSYPDAAGEDAYDGMKIIRRGTKTSVQKEARRFYVSHPGSYDLVIDEVNTMPFMSPEYVHGRIIALIHQLAREVWLTETPLPIALAGYLVMERLWLKKYRSVPTVTVSKSSEKDLLGLGFRHVYLVPDGLSYEPLAAVPDKENYPAIVYLGRLTKAKRVDHLLRAFALVLRSWPQAKLWIIGDGYQRSRLEAMANESTVFFGRLGRDQVAEMLSKAWMLVFPSVREGFGLTVIEANAHGTPAVGYDVPGIRDSIVDGKTGLLAQNGNIADLAECMKKLLGDRALMRQLSTNALEYSRGFSWDRTATEFERIIADVN